MVKSYRQIIWAIKSLFFFPDIEKPIVRAIYFLCHAASVAVLLHHSYLLTIMFYKWSNSQKRKTDWIKTINFDQLTCNNHYAPFTMYSLKKEFRIIKQAKIKHSSDMNESLIIISLRVLFLPHFNILHFDISLQNLSYHLCFLRIWLGLRFVRVLKPQFAEMLFIICFLSICT